MLKKLLSLFMTITILTSLFVVPATVHANSDNEIIVFEDDFEKGNLFVRIIPDWVYGDGELRSPSSVGCNSYLENKAEINYSEQHSEDKVYVETYDFQLYKTDGTKFLNDAGFKLYDAATGGNQITVAKDNTGYYVDASGTAEIMVDSEDGVNVRGLAPGTYYLEETTVPDGYNKLAGRTAVTIASGATEAVEITVVNNAGTELPSTGGIGTTIFYIVGAILVIGAVVVLVTRRRMSSK